MLHVSESCVEVHLSQTRVCGALCTKGNNQNNAYFNTELSTVFHFRMPQFNPKLCDRCLGRFKRYQTKIKN